MSQTKIKKELIDGSLGTDWQTAIQTSNFTAEAGKGYFVDTTSQVLSVNLPVGVVGMEITIQDYAGTFGTNKVILNANGSEKIQGLASEGKINTSNATAVLIYQDAIKGWTSQEASLNVNEISWATPTGQSLTYSTPSPQSSQGATGATFPTTTFTATKAGSEISGTATITGLPPGITAAQTITGSGAGNTLTVTLTGTFPSTDYINTTLTLSGLSIVTPPVSVDYLVVAGGGGGGGADEGGGGGGGGAGGYQTSFNNASLSAFNATIGETYTITIGAGGSSDANGINSSILGTGVSITSIAGGAGGNDNDFGNNGGSGGGEGGGGSNGSLDGGVGTPGQGNNGGANGNAANGGSPAYPYPGGGGGGAGAVGGIASGSTGANGGIGLENLITGTSTFFAGGGGGGRGQGSGVVGTGGTGGGGSGNNSGSSANGFPGTANTGGGGGGASSGSSSAGGTGGSGVVILRYPDAYTVTIGAGLTGSTTTDGSDKVTTFTAGTGNISFS